MPDLKSARRLARGLVSRRLAACVSFRDRFESLYRWKGKIAKASETVLMIKTSGAGLRPLEKAVRARHPYEVPEFLAMEVSSGSKDYLKWVESSVRPVIRRG